MSSPSPDKFPSEKFAAEKFARVAKAYETHIEGARKAGMPEEKIDQIQDMLSDATDLIATCTDCSDEELDVQVTAAILGMMPPSERPSPADVKDTFGEDVAKLIAKVDRASALGAPDKETARVSLAIFAATLDFIAERAYENPGEFAGSHANDLIRMTDEMASRNFEKADAPALVEAYKESLFDVKVAFAAAKGPLTDDILEKLEKESSLETPPPATAMSAGRTVPLRPMSEHSPAADGIPEDIKRAIMEMLGDEGSFEIINGDDYGLDELPLDDVFGDGFADAPAVNMDGMRLEADKILRASPEFNDAAAEKVLSAFDPEMLAKYPEVKPALQDLNRMFGLSTGAGLPEREIISAAKAVRIVDATVDGDQDQKCDAAIATILMRVPPQLTMSGIDAALARDYGAGVEKFIADVAQINFGAEPSAKSQPLIFANLIADVEGSVADIAAGRAQEEDIEHMRESAFVFSKRMSKMKIAPDARALSERLEESFVKLLDAADDREAKMKAEAAKRTGSPRL